MVRREVGDEWAGEAGYGSREVIECLYLEFGDSHDAGK